jgi:hypothetical protein
MLGEESADNLHLLDHDWLPREYMNGKWRDPIVAHTGLLLDMPHIQKKRLQNPGRVGYGIYIFKNRIDPNLKYAVYCTQDGGWDKNFLIVAKGKLFRLQRIAYQLNKLASQITNPPFLKEGLLDAIVQNTIGFLLKAKEIEKYGVKIKRGIILDGPPGNGKTMLCRYIQKLCSQNSINWGTITSSDIDEAYSKSDLNGLFTSYTVSFFDDIDISYMDRTKGNGKMACSLLTAMDGMYEGGHLVRIFTTNEEVKDLDKAFTRPGRIDKIVTLDPPGANLRQQLIESWPDEITNAIDVELCVQESDSFSFAELEAIRTFLVTNRILGDGTWSLDGAFDEFKERSIENKKLGVGFTSAPLKKKGGPRLIVQDDQNDHCEPPCEPDHSDYY